MQNPKKDVILYIMRVYKIDHYVKGELSFHMFEETVQDYAVPLHTHDFTEIVYITNVGSIEALKTGLNKYAYVLARKTANLAEGIGSAVASTTTKGYFGGTKGAAQFTQLVGITPEQLTDTEIATLDAANIAYYSNVSPVDGGGAEDFGYNWVIGSKMIGGTLRQRMMIMDYVEKAMALKTLEFLNTKPGYDEDGNATLWGMLQVLGRSLQTYELIIPDAEEQRGDRGNIPQRAH